MIAFPEMLVPSAKEAGIKVPEDLENFDETEFPHWVVFCNVQLGAPMPTWTSHWHNAQLISNIPNEEIKNITYKELEEKGLEVGYPIP